MTKCSKCGEDISGSSGMCSECACSECNKFFPGPTGMCSGCDPVQSTVRESVLAERNSQANEFEREIMKRQQFILRDTKNLSKIQIMFSRINRLCIENNKHKYYIPSKYKYFLFFVLKQTIIHIKSYKIIEYLQEEIQIPFLITAKQAKILCPYQCVPRIHMIYPHIGDQFRITESIHGSLAFCYYYREYNIKLSREKEEQENKLSKQIEKPHSKQ